MYHTDRKTVLLADAYEHSILVSFAVCYAMHVFGFKINQTSQTALVQWRRHSPRCFRFFENFPGNLRLESQHDTSSRHFSRFSAFSVAVRAFLYHVGGFEDTRATWWLEFSKNSPPYANRKSSLHIFSKSGKTKLLVVNSGVSHPFTFQISPQCIYFRVSEKETLICQNQAFCFAFFEISTLPSIALDLPHTHHVGGVVDSLD